MAFEDDRPVKAARAIVVGEDLAALSIGELEERIAALQAEIDRVAAAVTAKRASQSAAAAVFKL